MLKLWRARAGPPSECPFFLSPSVGARSNFIAATYRPLQQSSLQPRTERTAKGGSFRVSGEGALETVRLRYDRRHDIAARTAAKHVRAIAHKAEHGGLISVEFEQASELFGGGYGGPRTAQIGRSFSQDLVQPLHYGRFIRRWLGTSILELENLIGPTRVDAGVTMRCYVGLWSD